MLWLLLLIHNNHWEIGNYYQIAFFEMSVKRQIGKSFLDVVKQKSSYLVLFFLIIIQITIPNFPQVENQWHRTSTIQKKQVSTSILNEILRTHQNRTHKTRKTTETKPNSIPKEAKGQRANRLEAPTIFSKGTVSDRSASRPRAINCDREATPTASRFRRRRPISHRKAKPSAATRATNPATKPNKKETSIVFASTGGHRTLIRGVLPRSKERKSEERREANRPLSRSLSGIKRHYRVISSNASNIMRVRFKRRRFRFVGSR